MKRKNNKSTFVQEWTTQKLKRVFISIHQSIQLGCFSSHDLHEKAACEVELINRGYQILEGTPIITKI